MFWVTFTPTYTLQWNSPISEIARLCSSPITALLTRAPVLKCLAHNAFLVTFSCSIQLLCFNHIYSLFFPIENPYAGHKCDFKWTFVECKGLINRENVLNLHSLLTITFHALYLLNYKEGCYTKILDPISTKH